MEIDQSIKTAWDLVLIICACKKIAKTNVMTGKVKNNEKDI